MTAAGTASRRHVRRPVVAGTFYPADPDRLRGAVRRRLADAAGPRTPGLRGVIAPHAGYAYSGGVAGAAFGRVVAAGRAWRRVVVAGPAHHGPVAGVALPSHDAFATPLGDVPLDRAALRALAGRDGVAVDDRAHAREHSLEVELPFLQETVGVVPLVPLAVGSVPAELLADVLDAVWDDDTLLVVSTDLSHYLPYAQAVERDHHTAAAITGRRPEAIALDDACGAYVLRGFLALVRRRELAVHEVARCNSGDTAGGRDRVVGYGAFTTAAPARPRGRPPG